LDPLIKSQLLYQLSYAPGPSGLRRAVYQSGPALSRKQGPAPLHRALAARPAASAGAAWRQLQLRCKGVTLASQRGEVKGYRTEARTEGHDHQFRGIRPSRGSDMVTAVCASEARVPAELPTGGCRC
jgi:hypothetical protein